ncbi:MAG TPA: peptidase, partial [Candidatus Berkiella sp.]|nr:peptidase [Candidatus Berkiella sp.]
ALPIWMKFMGAALQGVPETKPEQPRGIITVRIDPSTGMLARPGQPNAIFEIFRQDSMPNRTAVASGQERNIITPSSSSGDSLF